MIYIKKETFLDKIILITLLLIIFISIVSGFNTNENPCLECHGSRRYYEYTRFSPTSSSAILPIEINEDSTLLTMPIEIFGSGSNIYYKISTMKTITESDFPEILHDIRELIERQNKGSLLNILIDVHPADIAYLLIQLKKCA